MTVKQRSNNLWCRIYMGEFKRFSNVTFTITQSIKNIRELFLKFGLILKMLCSNHAIWIFWLFCLKQCKEHKDDRWEIYPTLFPPFPLPVCPLWMAPPMYQENTVCGRSCPYPQVKGVFEMYLLNWNQGAMKKNWNI